MPARKPDKQTVYLQVRSAHPYDLVRHALVGVASVRASGSGTVSDPDSYWFELDLGPQTPSTGLKDHILDWLRPYEVSLQRLQKVPAGMGWTMSRQMDLFGRRVD